MRKGTRFTVIYRSQPAFQIVPVNDADVAADAWWQQIEPSPRLRWERIDAARFDKARNLFFRYRDKDFSFTDCTSFAVMQEMRLSQALTTDRHFQQMRFQSLPSLKKPPIRRV